MVVFSYKTTILEQVIDALKVNGEHQAVYVVEDILEAEREDIKND